MIIISSKSAYRNNCIRNGDRHCSAGNEDSHDFHLAHRPKVLFADEPTANLDRESSAVVMRAFVALHEAGQTIIMVTHEEEYARLAGRVVKIDDGRIVSDRASAAAATLVRVV